jgi:hypothetical protein
LRNTSSVHFAIAPVIDNKLGIRSNTINYINAGTACYISSFFLHTQTPSSATFTAQLGSVYSVQQVQFQKLINGTYKTIQSKNNPTITNYSFTDTNLVQGENRYRLAILLSNSTLIFSDTEVIYHVSASFPAVIYPNPVTGNSELKIIVQEAGRYRLSLMDISGRLVYQTILNRSVTSIPYKGCPQGLYFIWLFDRDGKAYTQKIIIQ